MDATRKAHVLDPAIGVEFHQGQVVVYELLAEGRPSEIAPGQPATAHLADGRPLIVRVQGGECIVPDADLLARIESKQRG